MTLEQGTRADEPRRPAGTHSSGGALPVVISPVPDFSKVTLRMLAQSPAAYAATQDRALAHASTAAATVSAFVSSIARAAFDRG